MYAQQITTDLATARRQDLIAEARAHRLAKCAATEPQARRAIGFGLFRRAGRVAFAR